MSRNSTVDFNNECYCHNPQFSTLEISFVTGHCVLLFSRNMTAIELQLGVSVSQ